MAALTVEVDSGAEAAEAQDAVAQTPATALLTRLDQTLAGIGVPAPTPTHIRTASKRIWDEASDAPQPPPAAAAPVAELFARIDTDGSNSISFAELTAWWEGRLRGAVATPQERAVLGRIRALVAELAGPDGDLDGELDVEGLGMLLRELVADEPGWRHEREPTEADIGEWLAREGPAAEPGLPVGRSSTHGRSPSVPPPWPPPPAAAAPTIAEAGAGAEPEPEPEPEAREGREAATDAASLRLAEREKAELLRRLQGALRENAELRRRLTEAASLTTTGDGGGGSTVRARSPVAPRSSRSRLSIR